MNIDGHVVQVFSHKYTTIATGLAHLHSADQCENCITYSVFSCAKLHILQLSVQFYRSPKSTLLSWWCLMLSYSSPLTLNKNYIHSNVKYVKEKCEKKRKEKKEENQH